ncbi:MAG: SflA family class IV lanthipeptide [Catenulispora sp.]
MATATQNVRDLNMNIRDSLKMNVRDVLKMNVRDLNKRNVRDVNMGVSSGLIEDEPSVGVLSNVLSAVVSGGFTEEDLAFLEESLGFEGEELRSGEHQACLAEPWVTATTRLGCED